MRGVQPAYFSVRETADYLHVTPRTVQNMLRRGELVGAIRIGSGRGSVIRIPVSALDQLQPYIAPNPGSDQ
jgi:excisionase family DNA binding protein